MGPQGHRLFFALWPDAAMRAALLAAVLGVRAQLTQARCIAPENWHLTLAFLGSIADTALDAAHGVAREVAQRARLGGPIELRLDRIEYWAKPQLVCASADDRSQSAQGLAQALREALAARGFTPDLKPFRAHVTLARKVLRPPDACAMAPVTWTFGEFALIESRTAATGSLYSVLAAWPLDGS